MSSIVNEEKFAAVAHPPQGFANDVSACQSRTPLSRLSSEVPIFPTSRSAVLTSSSHPLLPRPDARNILITSALPYVNNVPHLGNIIGSVLSGDVFARFCRLRGYNVIYICGTDEYGTATETKAIESGVTPQEICDHYYTVHASIYEWFDISFDYFGRTTTQQQTAIAQDIFNKCDANGYLIGKELEQLYCPTDQRFLADRFVEGECPECHYHDARGDQCDRCGHLLNAVDLINPKCKLCKSAPILRSSQHLFLDLGRLQTESLTEWIERQQVKGKWTENSIAVTKAWLDGGLKPRCITRDLKWGTPVPKPGYEDKVFYVWFDAPIGYISITANYTENWERWWKNPEQVQLYQFMGKDNIPFHCVVFPASLLATRESYTLLHHINATEYLNYESTKFSKSRGTGVFGDDVRSIDGIGNELWRYYMLTNRPEQGDTIFSWADFQSKVNTELLNNLGNFSQRTLVFIKNQFGGVVPQLGPLGCQGGDDEHGAMTASDRAFIDDVSALRAEYISLLDGVKIKDALRAAMSISQRANGYFQSSQPWELYKTNNDRCRAVINISVNVVYLLAVLLEPYMPAYAEKLCRQLNYVIYPGDLSADREPQVFQLSIKPGHVIGTPSPIFRKIEDSEILAYRARFGGAESKEQGAEFPLKCIVGEIKTVSDHPTAQHLYVLLVDIGAGDGKTRQIVTNVKSVYAPQQLLHKKVVILCNVPDTHVKGVKSEGVLLTAVKKQPSILTVSGDAAAVAVGSVVVPSQCLLKADANIDWKEKVKNLPMETIEGGLAAFGGLPWRTAEGINVIADNAVQGAKIQ